MSAPVDLLGHLDGDTFLRARSRSVEGPLGLLGDVLHMPVGTDITTRNVLFKAATRC